MRHDVGPKGIWGLNTDDRPGRIANVQLGLKVLGPDFQACACEACSGSGYRAYQECTWCRCVGITQHDKPAPASVLNQVLAAAAIASEILK